MDRIVKRENGDSDDLVDYAVDVSFVVDQGLSYPGSLL